MIGRALMTPTVIYRPVVVSIRQNVPAYYPKNGKRPGYGRLEIVPPADRPLPPPAPTYYRSWSSGSAPGPVTDYAPYNGPAAVSIEQYSGRRNSGAPKPTCKDRDARPMQGP